MSNVRPATAAKQVVTSFLREARDAGWSRAAVQLKPDGTVMLDVSMEDGPAADAFEAVNLRMGK
ncbi:hypothetical protein E2979_12845 [Paracoccus yeei]